MLDTCIGFPPQHILEFGEEQEKDICGLDFLHFPCLYLFISILNIQFRGGAISLKLKCTFKFYLFVFSPLNSEYDHYVPRKQIHLKDTTFYLGKRLKKTERNNEECQVLRYW